MFTVLFWLAAGERSIKTAAQVVVTFLGADLIDAFAVDYTRVAGIALGAAVVSVLTSLISAPVSPTGTPSLVDESGR